MSKKALQLRSAAAKVYQIVVLCTWQILTTLHFIAASQLLAFVPNTLSHTHAHKNTLLQMRSKVLCILQLHRVISGRGGTLSACTHSFVNSEIFTEAAVAEEVLESHWDVHRPASLSKLASGMQWLKLLKQNGGQSMAFSFQAAHFYSCSTRAALDDSDQKSQFFFVFFGAAFQCTQASLALFLIEKPSNETAFFWLALQHNRRSEEQSEIRWTHPEMCA